MAIEIERKYRVQSLGGLKLEGGEHIDQGYLAEEPLTIRVRTKGHHAYLTMKTRGDAELGAGALVKHEYEYEIPVADALELLRFAPNRLEKTRYMLPSGVEVDVFHGRHEGLILAEFESFDGSQAPVPPGVVWEEVTADARYSNAWMAKHGLPE